MPKFRKKWQNFGKRAPFKVKPLFCVHCVHHKKMPSVKFENVSINRLSFGKSILRGYVLFLELLMSAPESESCLWYLCPTDEQVPTSASGGT